jgi:hypothetical protein
MSRARALLLALAGLALPVGLALGVYVASAGSLEAGPTVIQPPAQIARSAATTGAAETQTRPETTSTTGKRDDDLPGKCDEPEHRFDPDCDPRTAGEDDDREDDDSGSDDDSSGKGSGGGDDDSGRRGGDDDSSGHGDDD